MFQTFINNCNVIFLYAKKHAFHSSNTDTFTVILYTNQSVSFVAFSVLTGFFPFMSLTINIVKHTARTSITEAFIVKTTQDLNFVPVDLNFKIFYCLKIFRKSLNSLSFTVDSPLYTRSTNLRNHKFEKTLVIWINS